MKHSSVSANRAPIERLSCFGFRWQAPDKRQVAHWKLPQRWDACRLSAPLSGTLPNTGKRRYSQRLATAANRAMRLSSADDQLKCSGMYDCRPSLYDVFSRQSEGFGCRRGEKARSIPAIHADRQQDYAITRFRRRPLNLETRKRSPGGMASPESENRVRAFSIR